MYFLYIIVFVKPYLPTRTYYLLFPKSKLPLITAHIMIMYARFII